MLQGDILKLTQLLENNTPPNLDGDDEGYRSRVYGGQFLGQGLLAALKKNGRQASSLKSLFMRPGMEEQPIDYETSTLGIDNSIQKVEALQNNKCLFVMMVDCGKYISPPKVDMPSVPSPSKCISREEGMKSLEDDSRSSWPVINSPFEYRFAENIWENSYRSPCHNVWFRVPKLPNKIGKSQKLQQAILAYFSDDNIMDNALFPHAPIYSGYKKYETATLDHSMWFHSQIDVGDWILFAQDSPVSRNGRGLTRGLFFNKAKQLIASAYQEILVR